MSLLAQQQALLDTLFAWPRPDATQFIATHAHQSCARGLKVYQANGHVLAERALQAASHCCAVPQPATRMVFVENTLHVQRLWISPALQAQAEAQPRLRITGERPLAFTAAGSLASPWRMPV